MAGPVEQMEVANPEQDVRSGRWARARRDVFERLYQQQPAQVAGESVYTSGVQQPQPSVALPNPSGGLPMGSGLPPSLLVQKRQQILDRRALNRTLRRQGK
jgi:hypothetical protein